MPISFTNYLFELSTFKEITREGKLQKLVKTNKLLLEGGTPLESKYAIIDIIFVSYNLVEHYVSPFLKKTAIKIVVKGFIMLKIQSLEKMTKKHPIFIANFSLLLTCTRCVRCRDRH
jgi:hypothetical protein